MLDVTMDNLSTIRELPLVEPSLPLHCLNMLSYAERAMKIDPTTVDTTKCRASHNRTSTKSAILSAQFPIEAATKVEEGSGDSNKVSLLDGGSEERYEPAMIT